MEAIAFERCDKAVKVYFVMELMSYDLRKLLFHEKKKIDYKIKNEYFN